MESVTRSTGVPVLKETGSIGNLLDIGERKKRTDGKRAEPPMFYSHLTLPQNMIPFDSLGAYTHTCVSYTVSHQSHIL